MECSSVINRNKPLIHTRAWMNLMCIILSERRLLKRLQTPRLHSCDMLSKAKLHGERSVVARDRACVLRVLSRFSRVPLFATSWTVACQAPLSMGFSRQEYWSGLPFPSPGDLPNPGIKLRSPTLQADALTSAPPGEWIKYLGYNHKME